MGAGFSILKGLVKLASEASVAQVVKNMVKTSMPYNLSGYRMMLTKFGGFVLSGIAADLAGKQVDIIFGVPNKKKEEKVEQPTLVGRLVKITGVRYKGKLGEITEQFAPGVYEAKAVFIITYASDQHHSGMFNSDEFELVQ